MRGYVFYVFYTIIQDAYDYWKTKTASKDIYLTNWIRNNAFYPVTTFCTRKHFSPCDAQWFIGAIRQRTTTHGRKLATFSPFNSLQQIPKFGNTWYFVLLAVNSWFIISKSLSAHTLPNVRLLDDVLLRSFCSVPADRIMSAYVIKTKRSISLIIHKAANCTLFSSLFFTRNGGMAEPWTTVDGTVWRKQGTDLEQVYKKLSAGARNVEARAKRALNFLVSSYHCKQTPNYW